MNENGKKINYATQDDHNSFAMNECYIKAIPNASLSNDVAMADIDETKTLVTPEIIYIKEEFDDDTSDGNSMDEKFDNELSDENCMTERDITKSILDSNSLAAYKHLTNETSNLDLSEQLVYSNERIEFEKNNKLNKGKCTKNGLQGLFDLICTSCRNCNIRNKQYLNLDFMECENCGGKAGFNCLKCDTIYIDVFELYTHIVTVHKEYIQYLPELKQTVKQYCAECDKTYAIHTWYEKQNCHQCDHKLTFQCLRCSKNHESYNGIIIHLKTCRTNNNLIDLLKNNISQIKSSKTTRPNLANSYKRYCMKCDLTINNNVYNNKTHCDQCNSQFLFQCSYCENRSETYRQMVYHLNYICQQIQKPKVCPKCRKDCISYIKLSNHVRYCGVKSNFNCSLCPYKTKSEALLNRHLKSHEMRGHYFDDLDNIDNLNDFSNLIKQYCYNCKEEIKNTNFEQCPTCRSNISRQCLKCNQQFDTLDSINNHIKLHFEPEVIKKYPCLMCPFSTDNKLLYEEHKKSKHSGIVEKNIRTCRKCNRLFKSRITVFNHLKVCKNQILHACNSCSYKTNYKLCLLNHRLTHLPNNHLNVQSVESDYSSAQTAESITLSNLIIRYCINCKKPSVNNFKLVNNLTCNECNTKVVFQCFKCKKQKESYGCMIYHVKTRCSIIGKFECSKCDYKTNSTKFLEKHIQNIHSNCDSYQQCSICEKNFKSSTALNKHLRICSMKPNLFCADCPYKTKYKQGLIYHAQIHLREDKCK